MGEAIFGGGLFVVYVGGESCRRLQASPVYQEWQQCGLCEMTEFDCFLLEDFTQPLDHRH